MGLRRRHLRRRLWALRPPSSGLRARLRERWLLLLLPLLLLLYLVRLAPLLLLLQ
jgi:hypothetical protein